MSTLLRLTIAAPLIAGCGVFRGPSRPSPVVALRPVVDSLVADPRFRGAQWGILVVDPVRGDTLYSYNAGKLFIPASNMKIVTGAVALRALGPDYRFSTMLSATQPIDDGVIAGDLLVTGTGDPTVSDRVHGDAMIPLRALADSLAARGLRRVTGRLANAIDVFPGANLGPGWEWDDLRFSYAAGVDELFFNEGFARVRLRGGAVPGDSALASTGPARTYPTLRSTARTASSADPRGARGIRVGYDSATTGALLVEGVIAPGDSADVTIAFRDQAHAYLSALKEALADRGITVEGGIESRPVTPPAATSNGDSSSGRQAPREPFGYPIVSTVSPTLREILPHFEKPSQNQIGEILLRTIGRARTGVGLADSGLRVVRDQMLAWGVAADAFVLRDGSGLSRHSVITPEAIVRVLDAMRRDSTFGTFYAALPVAGVDGTIGSRFRGTPVERNVHAKTGSLSMVRSLSGYVTTRDGHMLVFSILANHWIVPVREVERVQEVILARLANLTLGAR
jgi:D-alanyl-D-alanine carboxypeptidase/D-alanyl-D-alanine-endopeptidase (penicillin-binding protein 4)